MRIGIKMGHSTNRPTVYVVLEAAGRSNTLLTPLSLFKNRFDKYSVDS
jgi:hypothetical protein